jgi:serine/threonine protein kinase/Flp pilus assembly protein TadD
MSSVTLRARLLSGALTQEEAIAIAVGVCKKVAQAHAAGDIHGNLTSASILVDGFPSPTVAIEGFGENTTVTTENSANLAPERIAGEPPTVAGDVYSFGRILEQIRNAATLEPAIDAKWKAVVARCVEIVPAERFPSMDAALQAISGDERTLTIATPTQASGSPKKWGSFQLLQRLGAGGFGEVYRAWDLTLEREVALKLLLPQGLNPEEEYSSIVAEARAMARVRHPNTVSVYGVDRHDGRVGLWSDLVRGQTLARWVDAQGPLPEHGAAEIVMTLCNALSAVHHAGLLHCDIKPGNAMRADDGRILLMDFGLSNEVDRGTRWAGTLDYMAPELLKGQAPSVQSDIYAMGVLFLFLCTGEHPKNKEGESSKVARPAEMPAAMWQVIETATKSAPLERYSSAAKMRDAIASALAASAPKKKGNKMSWRARAAWTAAALIAAAALLGLIPQFRREIQARIAGTSGTAYQDFLAAEEALMRYDRPGNTQKAIELYNQTLARSPDFALAEAGLARADWRMYLDTSDNKWFDAASQAASKAATMNPNLPPVQMTLGMIHIDQGKVGLGTQELEKARQLDPRSGDIRGAMSEAYRVQGRLVDARNELQAAMDLAPDNWRWPYLLAALEIDSSDLKSAEVNLKIALGKTPDNPRVLYNLGLVYRKQGRYEEASRAFQDALAQDKGYSQAANALATVLTLQQHFDEAIVAYKRVVEMRPGDWMAWGSLATAEEFTGRDADEAARDYTKAIELATPHLKETPDDPFLVSRLGRFYASLHDSAQALPLLRKSLILAPNDPEVLERVAEGYELIGDRGQAIELLSKALMLGFSVDYGKKTPVFKALRRDPRAPLEIREAASSQ